MSETHVYENGEGHHAPSARTLLSVLLSRIVLCYFALYTVDVLVFILQRLLAPRNTPYSHPWLTGYLWDWMVPWIGQHLLHLKAAVVVNNIGADVPFEFILRGTELALALLASLLWTAIERKQRCDSAFDAWLRLFVRIALASVMLYYGFGKLIPMQFGPLTLHRLSRPLGELSPMGMLWAFMAASKGYTILCGAVEVLGGLLLLLPRLSTLGAFLSAGAMANVFVLNVFYDVNQKTRSLSYLLLALFLLAPYTRQLLNVLLWNRASEPVATQPLSRRRWLRLTFLWLPVVCGVLLLVRMIPPELRGYAAQQKAESAHDPVFGVWQAVSFTVADPSGPLFTKKLSDELKPDSDQYRWKRVIFDTKHVALIQFSSLEWDWEQYKTQASIAGGPSQVILTDSEDATWKCILTFTPLPGNSLQMSGSINGNEVHAVFQREDVDGAYHVTDPPRWISDGDRDY
jgi:uncharacterized membrane protein YphA (DoxX/SURF4 family)